MWSFFVATFSRRVLTRICALLCLLLLVLPVPATTASATVPKKQDLAIATAVINLMETGDFSTATRYISPAVHPTSSALQTFWQDELVAQYGMLKHHAAPRWTSSAGVPAIVIACDFTKLSLELLLTFNDFSQIIDIRTDFSYKAPKYIQPATFSEEAVTVGSKPWILPGTLTMPHGPGPWPAVVLIQGSGASDRDELELPNRIFRDIAWGLASQGIAVLRYDKRTFVYAAQMRDLSSLTAQEETMSDAIAAIKVLEKTQGIDRKHIFLLGHSLGGYLAPWIATQSPQLAGLILLAGPSRPLEDVYLDQSKYIQSLEENSTQRTNDKEVVATIKALTPKNVGTQKSLLLGLPAAYWLYLRNYHPVRVAQTIPQPMLIVQGARDYQVTLTDFNGWKAGLARRPHVLFKLYPNLFHLFMPVVSHPSGLAKPEDSIHPGHVDVHVINDITQWILRTSKV